MMERLLVCADSVKELDLQLADLLIRDFAKPGLVLLPAGKTFEENIYPLVNKYLQDGFEDDFQFRLKDKSYVPPLRVHPGLKVSHLDELVSPRSGRYFSESIAILLPALVRVLGDRFFPIDVNDISAFDKFVKVSGGPRVIYCGLGSDPQFSHIAYFGEEYINSSTALVELSPATQAQMQAEKAVTIGADIFEYPSLESIIVVAKGAHKAQALKSAFDDPDTGLGYLISKHSEKLKIYCDRSVINARF